MELDPCEWGSVGWMATGPPRGLPNLGAFVAVCRGPPGEPECEADRAQPSLTNVTCLQTGLGNNSFSLKVLVFSSGHLWEESLKQMV